MNRNLDLLFSFNSAMLSAPGSGVGGLIVARGAHAAGCSLRHGPVSFSEENTANTDFGVFRLATLGHPGQR